MKHRKGGRNDQIDIDYVMKNDKEMMRIFEKETLAKANQVDSRNQIRMKEQKNIMQRICTMQD